MFNASWAPCSRSTAVKFKPYGVAEPVLRNNIEQAMKNNKVLLMKTNVPNISDMALGPRIGEVAYLEIYGLKKAIREGKPEMTAGPNSKMERYVMNQQRYLLKLQRRGRVDLF